MPIHIREQFNDYRLKDIRYIKYDPINLHLKCCDQEPVSLYEFDFWSIYPNQIEFKSLIHLYECCYNVFLHEVKNKVIDFLQTLPNKKFAITPEDQPEIRFYDPFSMSPYDVYAVGLTENNDIEYFTHNPEKGKKTGSSINSNSYLVIFYSILKDNNLLCNSKQG